MEKSRETRGRLSQHDHQNKSKNLTAVLSFLTFLRTSSIAGLTGQKWQKSEIWTSSSPPAVTVAAPYPGRPSLFHLDGWSHLDGNDEAGHYMKLSIFSIKFFVSNQIWSFLAKIVCLTSLHGSLRFASTWIPIFLSQAFLRYPYCWGTKHKWLSVWIFFQQVWLCQAPFFQALVFTSNHRHMNNTMMMNKISIKDFFPRIPKLPSDLKLVHWGPSWLLPAPFFSSAHFYVKSPPYEYVS